MFCNHYEVLLINPPSSKGKVKRGKFFTPPMGLAYIASSLLEENISVKIFDCDPEGIFIDPIKPKRREVTNFFSKLKELNSAPLIIGIGPCTTPNLLNNIIIAKYSKLFFDKSCIILGGPHCSLMPPIMADRMIKEFLFIDAVVIGEGEITMKELLYALKENSSSASVAGVVYRKENENPSKYIPRPSIENLDALPFPARSLLKSYFPKYQFALRRNPLLATSLGKGPKIKENNILFTTIFSSRGCPYRCIFCCSPKKRRLRSPENVVSEIENCFQTYGIRFFIFYDDLFTTASTLEKGRVLKICNLIKEKSLNIFWQVELRADVICKLGKDILKMMNTSGCYTVNIGIEKNTQEGLDFLRKGVKIEEIGKAIDILRQSGKFIVNGTFILGGNSEDKSDLEEIIAFSQKTGLDYAAFSPLEIHPGTELFEIAKMKGIISDYWTPYQPSKDYPLFTTGKLSKRDLSIYKRKAFRNFYFRPKYIYQRIKKISSLYQFILFVQEYIHWFYHAFIEK